MRLYYKPLVTLIWIGALIMACRRRLLFSRSAFAYWRRAAVDRIKGRGGCDVRRLCQLALGAFLSRQRISVICGLS